MANREEWLMTKVNELERRLTEASIILGQHSGFFKLIGISLGIIAAGLVTYFVNTQGK